MPSIDATVAWAVPVEVEVLGAHLEAYVNLQPTINTLRMCHRFGKGDHAAITELPVELLNEVEEILMEEERRKRREEWETDFRCFQLHCDLRDHIDPSELDDLARQIEDDMRLDFAEEKWMSGPEFHDFVEERVDECVLENFLDKTHWERYRRWHDRVDATASSPMHISLNLQATYFEKQFGLAIWASDVSVDAPEDNCLGEEKKAGETTVAHLKLPTQQQTFAHRWPTSEEKFGDVGIYARSGCGVRLKEAKTPTDSETRRFKRAMDMLDLRPRVHETQVIEWNICRDVWREAAVDCNPQLMVLIRSSSD
ncbi:hypothetical protein KC345_g8647 [Hortaea werneckii]|nr:hypothetical protein KC345_g8647 [Hortaea werneckii]